MQQIQLKFKVKVSREELRDLRQAIEVFLAEYDQIYIDLDKEKEFYRLSDLHKLLYGWIFTKLNSMEKAGKENGRYEMPFTHILTLWHILQRVPISRILQRDFLAQIDKIKKSNNPIFHPQRAKDEIFFNSEFKPLRKAD